MRRSSWLISLLMGLTVCGCQWGGTKAAVTPVAPTTEPAAPAPQVYPLTSESLNFLGMEQVYRRQVGLKQTQTRNNKSVTDSIRDAYVMGDFLVVETTGRALYGFKRTSAMPAFLVQLTDPCDVRATDDKGFVYAVARNVLVGIDKRDYIAYQKRLPFAPSSRVTGDETNLYIGCFDGKVRAWDKTSRFVNWNFTTRGVVSSTPAVGSRFLYAGSRDGTLYALSLEDGTKDWEFETYGYIQADVVVNNHVVYVASADGSLYALNDLKQGSREEQLAWPMAYSSGSAILKAPVVSGETVVFVNESKQCHAVNVVNGRRAWMVTDVSDVLARGSKNTYCMRDGKYVLAIDNVTGDVHWLLDVRAEGVDRFLLNPLDGVVYLMKPDGTTIALREREAPAAPKPVQTPESPAGE